MSTELPWLEGLIDSFVNTLWWSLDQKLGRTNNPIVRQNPSILTIAGDSFQKIWDNTWLRLTLGFLAPYILRQYMEIDNPFKLGLWGVAIAFIWPWIYQICIYTWFLDPLRNLPGPKGHWLFGLGFGVPNEDLGFFALDFASTLTSKSTPSGLFTYQALGCRRVFPYTPATVSYIMNSKKYIKAQISNNLLRRLVGEGVLVVEGEEHKRQRKFLNPAFKSNHIKNMIPIFWSKGCELCEFWNDKVTSEDEFEIFTALTRTTLDVIGLAGFGYDFASLRAADSPMAKAFFTVFQNTPDLLLPTLLLALYPGLGYLPFSWIHRATRAKAVMVDMASRIIEEKSKDKDIEERDILGCMLKEDRRLASLGEKGLSKDEMIYQILTFLTAGHETTSTALCWALYELSEHPTIQTKLRAEIHSILGTKYSPTTTPTYDQLEQMKYLNNVCREVLRVDPSVPLTARQAACDDIIEGQFVPKDTLMHFATLVINMHPELWGEDAREFRPERWDELKDVPNTHFLTFQQGPHACLGRKFADIELMVLLAVLIGSFEFGKVPGRKVTKYSLVTMRPVGGLHLRVSKVTK